MDVNFKDMDPDVHIFWAALRGVGIKVDYVTADLINDVVASIEVTGKSKLTIKDTCIISSEHEKKWDKYFMLKKDEVSE